MREDYNICSHPIGNASNEPLVLLRRNLFGETVNQSLLTGIMDGMVSRKRLVDGVPTSFCDLGFCDVGLDDGWQLCGSYGPDNFTYHSEDGSPVVNTDRFPSFKDMTDYGHSLGLTVSWYGNNCICRESQLEDDMYSGDAKALLEFGFDGIKLDNCGKELDLDSWADALNATGKAVMIENCHWGRTPPHPNGWCPFNFYRTSNDVRASYFSVVKNLQTTVPFARLNLSYPGCWAFADGLELGIRHGAGGLRDPGLSTEESRAMYGAWSIVSSPLVLAFDVNNDSLVDSLWPIVANP